MEAIIGLLIEISFIATFTQCFLGRAMLRQPEQHPTEWAYRLEVQDQEATRPRRS